MSSQRLGLAALLLTINSTLGACALGAPIGGIGPDGHPGGAPPSQPATPTPPTPGGPTPPVPTPGEPPEEFGLVVDPQHQCAEALDLGPLFVFFDDIGEAGAESSLDVGVPSPNVTVCGGETDDDLGPHARLFAYKVYLQAGENFSFAVGGYAPANYIISAIAETCGVDAEVCVDQVRMPEDNSGEMFYVAQTAGWRYIYLQEFSAQPLAAGVSPSVEFFATRYFVN